MIQATKRFKAVDLFCGMGGMTEGAVRSGRVDVVLAINHNQHAIRSHSANHPDTRHLCSRVQDMDLYADKTLPKRVDLLMAGIECVFHSVARGDKPVDDQRRATAWRVIDWIERFKPRCCIFENVAEFTKWGPLGANDRPLKSKQGEIFDQWVNTVRAYGYHVEWRVLNSADYGEATRRKRLFIVAIRSRRKHPKVNWPLPTHDKNGANGLERWRAAREIINWEEPAPSIFARKKPLAENTLRRIKIGLEKFVAPFIINAQGPGYNDPNFKGVHGTDEPLRTLISKPVHGVVQPFTLDIHHKEGDRVNDAGEPLRTIVAKDGNSIVTPFISVYHGGNDERGKRNESVDDPLGTLDTQNRYGVAEPYLVKYKGTGNANDINDPIDAVQAGGQHYGVAQPYIVPNFGEREGQEPRTHDIDDPVPTVTSHGAGQLAVPYLYQCSGRGDGRSRSPDDPLPTLLACRNNNYLAVPWLTDVNHGHNGMADGRAYDLGGPLGTVTTHNGKALLYAFLTQYYGDGGQTAPVDVPLSTLTTKHRHGLALVQTMEKLGVVDIGFRMLTVNELKAAQGFPADYHLEGPKYAQVRQVGNSVTPKVMEALCDSVLPSRP